MKSQRMNLRRFPARRFQVIDLKTNANELLKIEMLNLSKISFGSSRYC